MAILKISILCSLFLFFSGFTFSQDTINMLNGQSFGAKVLGVTNDEVKYEITKRGKPKQYEIEKYRVFSIDYKDGQTTVLYKQDTLRGNFLTEEEMRYFVLGGQDALKYYRGTSATIIGFAMGAAGGFLLVDKFLIILVPFVPPAALALSPVRINKNKVSNPNYLNQEAYRSGYKRIAKNKKVINGLKGGLAGVVTGFLVFYAADNISR